ncbi:MAG: hypothetical protein Q8M96_21050 [Rubrivivax sp.]|nr:hypothetical protein [Rubrivivax sp.]
MKLFDPLRAAARAFVDSLPSRVPLSLPLPDKTPVRESAGINGLGDDEAGWTRLSANGMGAGNTRDLTPMSHERMQRLAEFLWQSNLLGNRLVEIPLAYLMAEGVKLQCADPDHQAVLDAFWQDPINDWPLKLTARARDLAILGEQCYAVFKNEASGHVRLGYVDPRQINEVVLDPDNAEQPIGVITKKDRKGQYKKFRVLVVSDKPDEEMFSRRTAAIRQDFRDGEVFLFQVNKLATGSRGRSDLLGQIDWIDAYDEFLFGELDRARFMRAFVWDLNIKTATPAEVEARARTFKPPTPNSVFVHNDGEELQPKAAGLEAVDMSTAARLFRNHVLAGATVPEHWFGGGGDVNRAAAAEMGDPTFKLMTARQTQLKLLLECIGRYVLASQPDVKPDWADPKWKVTAAFPELVSKDLTKFASAMREVTAAVIMLLD